MNEETQLNLKNLSYTQNIVNLISSKEYANPLSYQYEIKSDILLKKIIINNISTVDYVIISINDKHIKYHNYTLAYYFLKNDIISLPILDNYIFIPKNSNLSINLMFSRFKAKSADYEINLHYYEIQIPNNFTFHSSNIIDSLCYHTLDLHKIVHDMKTYFSYKFQDIGNRIYEIYFKIHLGNIRIKRLTIKINNKQIIKLLAEFSEKFNLYFVNLRDHPIDVNKDDEIEIYIDERNDIMLTELTITREYSLKIEK